MCSPMVMARVAAQLGPAERAAGAAAGPRSQNPQPSPAKRCFTHVVDLTHPLPTDFPSASGEVWLELEEFLSYASHGINFKRWLVHEHLGTHIDAPIHFSESGATAEQIPVESLVVPLAVIDIRERAEENPDTELTPEDVRAWEKRHGELPESCCLAVNTGWDRHATGPHYRNADAAGIKHFSGVHVDTAPRATFRPTAHGSRQADGPWRAWPTSPSYPQQVQPSSSAGQPSSVRRADPAGS